MQKYIIKFISVISVILAFALISSCSAKPSSDSTGTPAAVSPNVNKNQGQYLDFKDSLPPTAGGDCSMAFKRQDEILFKQKNLVASEFDISSLPVYKDKYPYNHGGPMFELTDEIKDRMFVSLEEITNYIGLEYNRKDVYIYDETYTGEIVINGYEIYAFVTGINIAGTSDIMQIPKDVNKDSLQNLLAKNKALTAACRFVGIENPEIIDMYPEYNFEGNKVDVNFTITEKGDGKSEMLYPSDKRIWIDISYELDHILLSVFKIPENMEIYADYELISYKQAKERLKSGEIYSEFRQRSEQELSSAYEQVKESLQHGETYSEFKYKSEEKSLRFDDNLVRCELEYGYDESFQYLIPYYKFYVSGSAEPYKSQDIQVYDIYYISACGEALDNDIKDNTPVDELVTMEPMPLADDTTNNIEISSSGYSDYTNSEDETNALF